MPRFTTTTTKIEYVEIAELDDITQPVAAAIRDEIVSAIKNIPTRPDGSRPFNETGHLVNGVRIEKQSDGSFSIVAPPDRLQEPKVIARLFDLVPMLSDPLSAPRAAKAVADSVKRALRR